MKVVIVSGPSAAGKTTTANVIAKRLRYVLCSKDKIKEALFDSLSVSTHRYLWYERTAKETFFNEIKTNLATQNSLVIESNFTKRDRKTLRSLLGAHIQIYEIHCIAKGSVRFRRFITRIQNGGRHPGHHDRKWYLSMGIECLLSYTGIRWPYIPMGLSESLYVLDTSDLTHVDYDEIIRFITE